jgi:hypothetical protein
VKFVTTKIHSVATRFAVVIFGVSLVFSYAEGDVLDAIIDDIGELEGQRDPKCYATASRLEDFMYGTPLTDDARHRKNLLQKKLAESIWRAAGEGGGPVGRAELDHAFDEVIRISQAGEERYALRFRSGAEVEIAPVDLRQYGSVAYSLRAILGVQQDALIDPGAQPLPPLTEEALESFKLRMDLAALALLKETDAYARAHDEYQVTVENLHRAWLTLYREAPEESTSRMAAVEPLAEPPVLLKRIIREKIDAYERYNSVSNPLFIRNMQVYFARLSWPDSEQGAEVFRTAFIEALVGYAADLYNGAVEVALSNGSAVISEAHVHRWVQRYTPFEVNEYEDVVYFPQLGDRRVAMEAYDLDAFRDSGVHWLYLGHALESDQVQRFLEVDPFAAELLAENVAQMGVLMLREAGLEGARRGEERLSLDLLQAGIASIQQKVDETLAGESVVDDAKVAIRSADGTDGPAGDAWFSDVTKASGIDVMHRSSDWLSRQLRSYLQRDQNTGIITIPPAFGGSGVAAGDIDNDGRSDLLVLSGLGNRLYRNLGSGRFEDITDKAGINWLRPEDRRPGEPRQPLIADLDNDGWQDIVITYVNDSHRVYRNLGNGQFEDLTERAGLGGVGLVGGPATVFDYDNDGLLDLYIQYFGDYLSGVLPTLARRNDNGLPDRLFKNLGDFRFREVEAGVGDTGWGQSTTHTDLDGDGWQDLISGNDFGANVYYRNNGNGTFTDITEALGTGKPSYTMNIGLADLNGDLHPDIYISNIVTMNKDEKYVLPNEDTQMKFNLEKLANLRVVEANDLFISYEEEGSLRYALSRDLVGRGYNATGWSWGASFFDADLDGDDDLYVLNGMNEFNLYSSKNAYADPGKATRKSEYLPVASRETNVFFLNSGGQLKNTSAPSGLDLLGNSRSAAYLDADGDGDLDILVNDYHGPAHFLRNNAERLGGNWIKLRLEGAPERGVNRDAIGARVVFYLPSGHTVWRELRGSEGYMTVHERVVHAGLGQDATVDASIRWPGGMVQRIEGLTANRTYRVTMGKGPQATDRAP